MYQLYILYIQIVFWQRLDVVWVVSAWQYRLLLVTLLQQWAGFCSGPWPAARNPSLLDGRTQTPTTSVLKIKEEQKDAWGGGAGGKDIKRGREEETWETSVRKWKQNPFSPQGTLLTAPASVKLFFLSDYSHISATSHLTAWSLKLTASQPLVNHWAWHQPEIKALTPTKLLDFILNEVRWSSLK